jgi:hypothetical protein
MKHAIRVKCVMHMGSTVQVDSASSYNFSTMFLILFFQWHAIGTMVLHVGNTPLVAALYRSSRATTHMLPAMRDGGDGALSAAL